MVHCNSIDFAKLSTVAKNCHKWNSSPHYYHCVYIGILLYTLICASIRRFIRTYTCIHNNDSPYQVRDSKMHAYSHCDDHIGRHMYENVIIKHHFVAFNDGHQFNTCIPTYVDWEHHMH